MIDWNISPESSSLSCLLGWNPSLFSFNYYSKLLTMIDWNISPESSSLSCLLGWNPSLFSLKYYSKLLTMIDLNISLKSCCLSCFLGWNPGLFSFNYYSKLLTMIDWNISPESSSLFVTGLESQFKSKVKYTKFWLLWTNYKFRELSSPSLLGWSPSSCSFNRSF